MLEVIVSYAFTGKTDVTVYRKHGDELHPKKVMKEHTIVASFRAKGEKAAWTPFADVKAGDWFYESVQYVYEKGLMNGTDSDRFSPAQSTSRAMLVAMLWRLEGQPAGNGAAPFTDVAANAYYAETAP